jgi:hypothetical protein
MNNPIEHYSIKGVEDGIGVTVAQIKGDATLCLAAREYRNEQIESLVVELLRYQGWKAKPFQSD